MDVKIIFLNDYVEEGIYIKQPMSFESEDSSKVYKLTKSIYGLMQASRSWNYHFNEAIQSFGFIKNEDESCMYKKVSGSQLTFLGSLLDPYMV